MIDLKQGILRIYFVEVGDIFITDIIFYRYPKKY